MRSLLTILLLCLVASGAFAGTLSGTIRSAKGETLPYATVFVSGTTIGTAANAAGNYQLDLQPGTYVITCQYIGYQQTTFNVTITGSETLRHDFKLADQSLEMKEVVVRASDEDPAYRIIREAIKKREAHLKQVENFQTSIYLKGVLRTSTVPKEVMGEKIDKGDLGVDSNGRGVLYLCEEVADYYSQQPDRNKTIIHSVKQSGDPNGMGLSRFPPVVSFYSNNVISLNGSRSLISPIASNALANYKYKLEGEFQEGRNTIYKIKVIPKRAYDPLCFGHIYIVDGDWAIHSLSLTTTARYGLEQLDTLKMDQQFLPLKKDVWVIKNQQYYMTLGIFGFGIRGSFITVYDNQKVNQPIPDSIFSRKIVSTYDKQANKKDSVYWEDTRPLPLENDEVRDYRYKDSMRLVYDNPQRRDSMRRRANRVDFMDIVVGGMSFADSGYRNILRVSPIISSVNFNSVEGLNYAPQISWAHRVDTGVRLELNTALRYGFANRHFNGIGLLSYIVNDKNWRDRSWSLSLEGGRYVFQYDRNNPVSPLINTVSTLVFNYNMLKLYERWTAAAYFRRNFGNGLQIWGRAGWERRLPLENATSYTWGDKNSSDFTSNIPTSLKSYLYKQHDAAVIRLGASYQPGFRYVDYPNYRQSVSSSKPVFRAQYEKGIPDILGSDVDWDKWHVGVRGDFRLGQFGTVSYDLSGTGFFNNKAVGAPDLIHPLAGGNVDIMLAARYMQGFQLAPFYHFSNSSKHFSEVHVEYDLNGLISNKIPGLRQLQATFVLGTNSFYGNENFWYSEAFFAIDKIGYKMLKLMRVDLIKGWDAQKQTYQGIRVGLNLDNFVGTRNSDGQVEWLR
jgi:hypothetical protein